MEGYDVMKMTIISGVCVIATTLNVFFFYFIVQERFMSVCIRVCMCVCILNTSVPDREVNICWCDGSRLLRAAACG